MTIVRQGGVRPSAPPVLAASPRYLLTMELLAARVDADEERHHTRYRLCGFTTGGEGIDLLTANHPGRPVASTVEHLLEAFSSRRADEGSRASRRVGLHRAPSDDAAVGRDHVSLKR